MCSIDKESIIRGLKETILPISGTSGANNNSVVLPQPIIENEIVISRQFSKSIKNYLEQSITELDSHISQLQSPNNETWKIDAFNLSKTLLNDSRLTCIQENLNNILDGCLNELNDVDLQNCNDTDIDVSPLLQPEHLVEIAECISVEKPLDVRINAFRVLCKSHFTDAMHGEGWRLLHQKLVDNLSDNNKNIFLLCLKAHAKLASCSSPEAIKECSLNLIDSLGRHYYLQQEESEIYSFQSIHFYRSVYLVFLLLRAFKEATSNIARFGESKLEEMIENFVQLLSIDNGPQNHSKAKLHILPLEIVSFLDPYAKWILNFTHFNLSRQLLFSSLFKNTNFVKICTEKILGWLSEPVVPSANTSKISDGEINMAVRKFSLFSHCLTTLTSICSFRMGVSMFPVSISKENVSLSIEDILDVLITSIDDPQINDILHTKTTSDFRSLLATNLSKMVCLQQVNGNAFLLKLLKPKATHDLSLLKTEILLNISSSSKINNPLICSDLTVRKKHSLFSHCFIPNNDISSNQYHWSIRQKREIEHQVSLGDAENNQTTPFELYLKLLLETGKQNMLREDPRLIVIMTNMLKHFEKLLGISHVLKSQIIQLVGDVYTNISEKFKYSESNIHITDINTSNICEQFLLQCGMTPLGFHILKECGLVTRVLYAGLQSPESIWSNYVWLNFISKVSATEEGCRVISTESNNILRNEFMSLWNIIDEDHSGSELPIKECTNDLLKVITLLTLNTKGVRALLNEVEDGSEITITDDWDSRPSNLFNLIKNFALSCSSCTNFIHHHFSLTVLDIIVSNIDSCIYLLNKFNFQDSLLQLQADNRVDENSDVIVDECSLLRQKIIEKSYLPGRLRAVIKPTHTFPRPDSTLTRTKPRSRGNGEFARWLTETRPGLHDHSWLKHARKLYRNSPPDEIKGATIVDLLEQVVKILPEAKTVLKWSQDFDNCSLEPEEQLAVQLVVRYGAHHRIFQATQSNIDNLSQLILMIKTSFDIQSEDFKGFDWLVASSFLICSGNIEKTQNFLSLILSLPTVPLLWSHFGEASITAQLGNVLEVIVSEEMPALFHVLQTNGLSWWQLSQAWMSQCWWGILDWTQICHWFMTAILHQPDHLLYFCAALLHSNHDRLLQMTSQGNIHEIITNPAEKFQLGDARVFMDKLHKKYHGALHSYLS